MLRFRQGHLSQFVSYKGVSINQVDDILRVVSRDRFYHTLTQFDPFRNSFALVIHPIVVSLISSAGQEIKFPTSMTTLVFNYFIIRKRIAMEKAHRHIHTINFILMHNQESNY